ncbi:MAG: hypothetical protein LBU85_04440 [Treponema sp.]|nr:hypothetical protein [Treponema sp.]
MGRKAALPGFALLADAYMVFASGCQGENARSQTGTGLIGAAASIKPE